MVKVVETYKFREFIDYIDKAIDRGYSAKIKKYEDAFCPVSWEEAKELAKNGIKEQSEIEKIFNSMCLLENVKTKGYNLSENGLCIDIGTYLQNDPECWISEDFIYKPKKVVKILVNLSYCGIITPIQIKNRGASIISLIQMLKKQGYIVKINLYSCCKSSFLVSDNMYTLFLKIPSNPLNLQTLSYAICDSSMLRRFIFGWQELNFNKNNDASEHYGHGEVASLDEEIISKDLIHFPNIIEECSYSDTSISKQYIINTFNEFLKLNKDTGIIGTH